MSCFRAQQITLELRTACPPPKTRKGPQGMIMSSVRQSLLRCGRRGRNHAGRNAVGMPHGMRFDASTFELLLQPSATACTGQAAHKRRIISQLGYPGRHACNIGSPCRIRKPMLSPAFLSSGRRTNSITVTSMMPKSNTSIAIKNNSGNPLSIRWGCGFFGGFRKQRLVCSLAHSWLPMLRDKLTITLLVRS